MPDSVLSRRLDRRPPKVPSNLNCSVIQIMLVAKEVTYLVSEVM